MKILIIGAGGVGNSLAKILATRSFYDSVIVSDFDLSRAHGVLEWIEAKHPGQRPRFQADHVDASSVDQVSALARKHGPRS